DAADSQALRRLDEFVDGPVLLEAPVNDRLLDPAVLDRGAAPGSAVSVPRAPAPRPDMLRIAAPAVPLSRLLRSVPSARSAASLSRLMRNSFVVREDPSIHYSPDHHMSGKTRMRAVSAGIATRRPTPRRP